jgi:enterochelin esterase-like enzyme
MINMDLLINNIKKGVKFDYYDSKDGGHTWPVWREDLYLFAQKLFK